MDQTWWMVNSVLDMKHTNQQIEDSVKVVPLAEDKSNGTPTNQLISQRKDFLQVETVAQVDMVQALSTHICLTKLLSNVHQVEEDNNLLTEWAKDRHTVTVTKIHSNHHQLEVSKLNQIFLIYLKLNNFYLFRIYGFLTFRISCLISSKIRKRLFGRSTKYWSWSWTRRTR